MTQVGFKGSLQDFFKFMQHGPAFSFKTRGRAARVLPRARSEDQRRRSRSQFSLIPKAPFEIRPVEPFRAQSAAGGQYLPAERGRHASRHLLRQHLRPADAQDLGRRRPVPARGDPRPPLPDRAAAGAHRHAEVPPLRRRDRLRRRLGPVRRGRWARTSASTPIPTTTSAACRTRLWRAIRLVVDTGLHSKGWTREQVIKYMLDNSAESETQSTAEAERYIAMAGAGPGLQDRRARRSRQLRAPRREGARAQSSTSASSTPRC